MRSEIVRTGTVVFYTLAALTSAVASAMQVVEGEVYLGLALIGAAHAFGTRVKEASND